MISAQENYRSYLKDLLAERISRNPSYSLRAFAAKVGVAQGFLSEVMRGRKNLSPETAAQIARRLDLPTQEAERFCLLVQLDGAKNPEYRQELLSKVSSSHPNGKFFDLTVDAFRVISDWYHFPILDLTEMADFKFSPRNVAKRLGLSVFEAEAAIERLTRLELLEKTPEGSYRKTKDHFLAQSNFQHEAVIKFHRQILERLLAALGTQERDERLSRTEVILIDPELYPKAEAILDRAAEDVVALALKSKKKSRVCALGLHLFNLIPERK